MKAGWDTTWMAVADAVAQRSPCVRTQCGAVIVDASNRIVATGYNGFPARRRTNPQACSDHPHPDLGTPWPVGCPRAIDGPADPHVYTDCFSIHAEANALLFCDRREREGGTIYITTNLCWECAKLVANSGLVRVVMRSDRDYRPTDQVVQLLADCFIELVQWEN